MPTAKNVNSRESLQRMKDPQLKLLEYSEIRKHKAVIAALLSELTPVIASWQQENEYVLSGYRPTSGSVAGSFRSLLFLHNETVSIHSHVVGALLFAWLPYYFRTNIYSYYASAELMDFIVISIYSLGVAVCFVLSSTCHIVWNCTPAWASYGNQLDYLGIVLLMWGASIPTIYYGFYCDPQIQVLYWTLMTAAAIGCSIFTVNQRFAQPKFRPFRAAMYASLGLSAIVFVVHGLILHGLETQRTRMSLDWMIWMAFFNFIGAGFYAARIPERWFPYTFDIYGASHQIFHVMVIVAALVHFAGLLQAMHRIRTLSVVCETI